jgi:predicted dinucleotide-binding enzyme
MGADGLHLLVGHDASGAEQVAAWAAGASVFKTLNQTGAENMADAAAYHLKPVMFIAGDQLDKKPAVMRLVSDLGFHAIDVGPLRAARLLEPLALLWIDLAMKRGQARDFAFAMVHPRKDQD